MALPIRVRALILGEWVDFGPAFATVGDYFVDYFVDYFLGRTVMQPRRLPAQEIGYTFGRSDETSECEPQSISIELWNEDGWLTPGDPRSPYWAVDGSGWGRGTLLEVSFSDADPLYFEVSEVEEGWPHGDLSDPLTDEEKLDLGLVPISRLGFATVVVTASGVLRRLGQGRPPLESSLRQVVTRPQNLPHVAEYWPMEDGSDAVALSSALPGHLPMRFSGGMLSPGSDSTLAGSKPLPSLSSGQSASWLATGRGHGGLELGSSYVVEVMVKVPDAPDAGTELIRAIDLRTTGDLGLVVDLSWDSVPILRAIVYDGGVEDHRHVVSSPPDLWGEWCLLRLEVRSTTEYALYWAPVTPRIDPVHVFVDTLPGIGGIPWGFGGLAVDAPEGGFSIGHMVVHDGIANGWLVPADTGWQGEVALGRIRRFCRDQQVPLTWDKRDPAGDTIGAMSGETTRMGTQQPTQLVDILHECEASDGGILCERGIGLHYRTRKSLYNQTPKVVLDAAASDIANPFSPVLDDQQVRTSVKVTRIGGGSAVKIDPVLSQPPPVGIGLYEESYDLSLFDDEGLHHHAGWRLHQGVFAEVRYPQVTIDLGIRPDLEAAVTALVPGDRIQIVNLPPQHPLGTVDLMVQGGSWNVSPFGWTVTLNCSPYAPWIVGRWEESCWSLASTLAAPVDADDTSLSVAFDDTTYSFAGTTYTPKWTTDSGSWPIDLLVGGCEQVTATAVSGSSSPQAFTVTRNVNGLGRAHPAGAEVRLYEPAILGL